VLARSRAPGAFVERKRFSLSRDKAIDKLREFSLRNPRQYVLELIQSAVFSGASYIAVDVDREQCTVAWVGGQPFHEGDLVSVFDNLFRDRSDLEHRPMIQLAVALNAMLQRRPRALRVESGDGSAEGTVRLDLDRKGNGVLGIPDMGLAGTYVMADFGSDWFGRFSGDTSTPEERLVEERCRFSPVPILLNGRAPFGYRASRSLAMPGCPMYLPFDDGERYGVLAAPPRVGRVEGVALVVGGVRVTTKLLLELGVLPAGVVHPAATTPLTGVIADDRLRKTADHSDIVRERRFAEMLHAVQPHATELIRQLSGDRYEPPALPRLVGGAKVVEDLPEIVPQIPPRPDLPRDALRRIPEGAPVFRVRPTDADALADAVRPDRFPHPVLVVPDTQVAYMEDVAPHLAVHCLNSADEVAFVDRMLERRVRERTATVPFQDPVTPAVRGSLELTLHLEGPRPLLHDPADGDVSVLVSSGARMLRHVPTQLGLTGVRAHLVLDPGANLLPDEPLHGVDQAILDGAWALVGEETDDLLVTLLAAHMQPHFVIEDARTALQVGFPEVEDADLHALRARPLVQTEEGPLSLDGLVALMGTDRVLQVEHDEALARVAPLEERLGMGHLASPSVARTAICAVGRGSFGWFALTPGQALPEGLTQMMWVGRSLQPRLRHPDWVPVDTDLPGVGAARRPDHEPVARDWEQGTAELYRTLRTRLRFDAPDDGVDMSDPRSRGMARLAVLHLGRKLGRLGDDPLLQALGSAGPVSLDQACTAPGFAAWPRFGPAVLEDGVLQLSLDELSVLQSCCEIPVRFDDPPSLWDSLADRGASGWLVRTEVTVPGMRGWLGLRNPFDATSGVFLQADGIRVAVPDVDARVPCHGLLRKLGSYSEVSSSQMQLLRLARERLYREVGDLADDRSIDPALRETARQYRTCHEQARRPDEEVDEGKPRVASRGSKALDELARRLAEASGGVLDEETLYVRPADDGPRDPPVDLIQRKAMVSVLINRSHPLAEEALSRPGRARELILMEALRQVASWGAMHGRGFDLLDAQQVLVAQRLGL